MGLGSSLALSELGSTALSSGLSFMGNLGSSVAGGLFAANQARKNRQFQERMYNQQVQDNINFWKLQQDYNLPSAQLERIRQAGLSPLLLYGEGGLTGNIASQAPQSAQAPHGAQASASFHTPIEFANLALLHAQTDLLKSEAEKNRQESAESVQRTASFEQDVLLKRLTKDINVAIRYRDYDFLNTSIDQMRNEIFNSSQLRLQNVLTMSQAREYQIKHYNLDQWQIGEQIAQGWENIKIGKINASAAVKQAAAAWQTAVSLAGLNNAQIGEINQRIYQMRKIFPEQLKQTQWMTRQQQLDFFIGAALKGIDIEKGKIQIVKDKIGAVRVGLGNDQGIATIFAPLQMPMKNPVSAYDDYYGK